MPKRPRQHQLEDESRTAFRASLPPQWVFRDSVPDYGIDGSVEVFDEGGKSTGRSFLAQLKATDEPNLDLALAVSFRQETWDYYRSLDLPVLVVRYHAPSRKLYARWFHTFDPYYARKGRKSFTFRLLPEDEWQERTPKRLIADLETLRQIRSPQLLLPLSLQLVLREPELHGIPSGKIALAIRQLVERLAGVLRIADSPEGAIGSIELSNEKVVVTLGGKSSFTLHTAKGYPREKASEQFQYDVLVSIGLAVDHSGHSEVGARLIAEYAANSLVISQPEAAVRMIGCMARAHRVTEALELSERMLRDERAMLAAEMLVVVPLLLGESLSATELEHFRRFLERRIHVAGESGDRLKAAAAHYTLANHLRTSSNRLAVHHYKKALEYDPGYAGRPHFCQELAGVLFEGGRYRLSGRWYARAMELGERQAILPLYADALMFCGRYWEAREAFEEYLASAGNPDPEWRLKSWLLGIIRDLLGLNEQTRGQHEAMRLAKVEEGRPLEEVRARLEESLHHDALCAVAWFNLGVTHSKIGDQAAALVSFLAAALIRKGDVEAWGNAILLAVFSEEYRLMAPYMVEAAYQLNGERLSQAVVRIAESQPEGFPVGKFLDAWSKTLASIPRKRQPISMRAIEERGQYREIFLRPPEP